MQILFVVNDLGYFRAHRQMLAEHFASKGHDVVVASGACTEEAKRAWPDNIALVELPIDKHRLNLLADLQLLWALLRIIGTRKPHIVHAITIKPILFSGLAVSLRRLFGGAEKLVWTFPGLGKVFEPCDRAMATVRKVIVTMALRLSAKVSGAHATFENACDRKILIDYGIVPATRATVVEGTGLDTDVFKPEAKTSINGLTFLMATRLIEKKGVDVFLETARDAKSKGLDAKFVLAGLFEETDPGSMDPSTIQKAHEDGAITFLGAVDQSEMPRIINSADVVCLPTRLQEGFPRALLEAAACGVAMIASRQSAIEKVVVDGETGWLLDPPDSSALIAAVGEALNNPDLVSEYGRAARALIEALPVSNAEVADAFAEVYGLRDDGH
ncbi:glycosyltransferase [Pseudahrensia aquimaris]|uniref:Glycosyltransferase n=1 Tax=Pseudahrensia aquimaris TaxID=744461 RepID=A0ABW3FF53_9HYPH